MTCALRSAARHLAGRGQFQPPPASRAGLHLPASRLGQPKSGPGTQGQPSQSCLNSTAPAEPGNATSAPGSAFNENGGIAGGVYAGAGAPSLNANTDKAISQYDVACFRSPAPATARRSAPWSTGPAGLPSWCTCPVGGHTAEAVRDALVAALAALPAQLSLEPARHLIRSQRADARHCAGCRRAVDVDLRACEGGGDGDGPVARHREPGGPRGGPGPAPRPRLGRLRLVRERERCYIPQARSQPENAFLPSLTRSRCAASNRRFQSHDQRQLGGVPVRWMSRMMMQLLRPARR